MKLRLVLLFLVTLAFTESYAQGLFGYEWIKPSQTYFKIKVTQNSIYRISFDSLQQLGAPVSAINPKNFQLYKNGIEEALYVYGEEDGQFNNNDFIEFFGVKNDGTLDTELYTPPSAQPHQYYSLFSDTSVYFLTWTENTSGKRFTSYSSNIFTGSEESYFLQEVAGIFPEVYYNGADLTIYGANLSEYVEGEGFLASQFGKGASQTRTLSTPGFVDVGQQLSAIISVAGRSNASSSSSFNHHLQVLLSKDNSTFTIKHDTSYLAFNMVSKTVSLTAADIGATTYFKFSSIDDLGAASDYQALSYIRMLYTRDFNLRNTKSLQLNFTGLVNTDTSYVRFTNYSGSFPLLYDLSNNLRIKGSLELKELKLMIPGAGKSKELFLTDSTDIKPVRIEKAVFNFDDAESNEYDFIIITHESLMPSAQQYATYRSSTGYKPLLVTSTDLYNRFFYGHHHPLAIRHFADYLLQKGKLKPQYLLLLGKGIQTSTIRSAGKFQKNLVPSIGVPPSDNMFTSGLDSTYLEPAIATGRVGASTNEEVLVYLEKLIGFESLPDSYWRKEFLHLAGGGNTNENAVWSGYMRAFQSISDNLFFGSKVTNYFKNVNEPIVNNLKDKLVAEVNDGVSLLSFFGHGAYLSTEINFGQPNELSNKGKYPVYLINGCLAGNPFLEKSLGENYLFEKGKGAIGWIATSDEGFPGDLAAFSKGFYENAFHKFYGYSIAFNLKQAVKNYQNPNAGNLNRTHARQYTFQGDPALKFYSPSKPDYFLDSKDLYFIPDNVSALSDSFAVAVVVRNQGKATNDSIDISVEQTFADQSVITHPVLKYKPVYNIDTFYYYIKNADHASKGLNSFKVTIDGESNIDELSELNNTVAVEHLFPSESVNVIYPRDNAIVADTPIRLLVQANNLFLSNAEYIFEIDTVITFNSGWKKTSGIITKGTLPSWSPGFNPDHNKVYYWRVRRNLPLNEGGKWERASFTYSKGSENGWNQSHHGQLQSVKLKNIAFDSIKRRYLFALSAFGVVGQTRGDDAPKTDERQFRFEEGGLYGFIGYEFTGVTFIALHPVTLESYLVPIKHHYQNYPGEYSGQYLFNTNQPEDIDSMALFINGIPDGYYVMAMNGRGIDLRNTLTPAAVKAFESLGCAKAGTIPSGFPYLFFGKKGASPGSIIELTADTINSSVPGKSQQIRYDMEYYKSWDKGTYSSQKIGPVTKWKTAYFDFLKDSSDIVSFSVRAIGSNNHDTVIAANLPDSIDLRTLDASIYPFIEMRADVSDPADKTAAQIRSWKVSYDETPEGTLNPEAAYEFYSSTIQQGDSLRMKVAYQNISNVSSDSILVNFNIVLEDRSVCRCGEIKLPPIAPLDTVVINRKISTRLLNGNNRLLINAGPAHSQDLYNFNNYLNIPFKVMKDIYHPMLDVLVDGRRIINGDLISPRPVFTISVSDENKFLLLTDTSVIDLFLKKENQAEFRRLSYQQDNIKFNAAKNADKNKTTVIYQPESNFENGFYTLKVKAKDATGNPSGNEDYQIRFEIVNESSITHFLPYPNPFTTQMKFIYTLTGSQAPTELKIQLMTPSGKIVREITQHEFGQMKTGNHMSDFTWDGTDQFGDRLANGVYFYRVTAKINGQYIKHRETTTDRFFKNEMGKIYLMR